MDKLKKSILIDTWKSRKTVLYNFKRLPTFINELFCKASTEESEFGSVVEELHMAMVLLISLIGLMVVSSAMLITTIIIFIITHNALTIISIMSILIFLSLTMISIVEALHIYSVVENAYKNGHRIREVIK